MGLDSDLQSIQEVRTKVELAYAAWQKYRRFTQLQVDSIVEAMAAAARAHSRRVAEMAVEETGPSTPGRSTWRLPVCRSVLAGRLAWPC